MLAVGFRRSAPSPAPSPAPPPPPPPPEDSHLPREGTVKGKPPRVRGCAGARGWFFGAQAHPAVASGSAVPPLGLVPASQGLHEEGVPGPRQGSLRAASVLRTLGAEEAREERGPPTERPEQPPPRPQAPPRPVLCAPDSGRRREGRGAPPGRERSRNLTPGQAAGPRPGLPAPSPMETVSPREPARIPGESHLGFGSWRISPRPHLPSLRGKGGPRWSGALGGPTRFFLRELQKDGPQQEEK
ncbi:hypothetical protein VULLAG_LOCUS2939 [Vulpes lagopus]